MRPGRTAFLWAPLAVLAVLVASCAAEDRQSFPGANPGSRASSETDGQAPEMVQGQCRQALAEPLPASLAAMAGAANPAAESIVTVQSVVNRIQNDCAGGGCHSTPQYAFFVASPGDLLAEGGEGFKTQGEWALAHIEGDLTVASTDPTKPCVAGSPGSCEAMPKIGPGSPLGKAWSERLMREPDDEIGQLDQLLHAWVAAGKPADQFALPMADAGAATSADGGVPSAYPLPPHIGAGMTNLGNCIPDRALVGTEIAAMDALDAKFAALKRAPVGTTDAAGRVDQASVIGLPSSLSETDLTTFDTAELARRGVIAFVPQYPLWSDDAGKLRFVRVPRGQSIHLNKATQEFDVPPNTRFYKTFLKLVTDTDGNPSYRKIETRLIVSQPDPATATDQVSALYGTYRWDDDEKNATLITTALNDGTGFTDTLFPYDVDINLAKAIRDNPPTDLALDRALLNAGAVRHYAIPSSTRCVQCHMGSPGRSFILGFRPVQINHRPVGQGGVIEVSGPDEMTQLQRLIDLGVISGVDSLSDILPLEDSEGDRKPRNDYELTAQGYMLGNCSHCHNPVGYPSFTFPQLVSALDFVPGPTGGIFQFPLERTSPRIFRGPAGDVPIPYITPSLLDNPSYPSNLGAQCDPTTGDTVGLLTSYGESTWLPKWPMGSQDTLAFVYAPWRSLIYRNVDNPFAYTDDYAIYPHMPMNTPGFDCRAKQILGDWMVSIPAVLKRPDIDEYVFPYPLASTGAQTTVPVSDVSVQPYIEVPPASPGYDAAQAAARSRLEIFHTGIRPGDSITYKSRYATCPDTTDIVDPDVDLTCHPIPREQESPLINVPTHPHWVPLDLTTSNADWSPRDQSWQKDIVDRTPVADTASCSSSSSIDPTQQRQTVVNFLQNVWLDDTVNDPHDDTVKTVKDFLTETIPFGLWKDKPECDWKKIGPNVTTVQQELAKIPHPAWLDGPAGGDGTRHVYRESMGAAVFNQICINCHGPNADSHGRLADNLATMTGGHAQVADFRDGLFGPQSRPGQAGTPGQYRLSLFGSLPGKDPAMSDQEWADTWGARYMAFMALGGTRAIIPDAFLTIVSHSAFFGEFRDASFSVKTSGANMLSIGRSLCRATLQFPPFNFNGNLGYFANMAKRPPGGSSVLSDNGDAEMWLKLCALNNPPPVVPYAYNPGADARSNLTIVSDPASFTGVTNFTGFLAGAYPTLLGIPADSTTQSAFPLGDGAPTSAGVVGDENGQVSATLGTQNLHPWCIGDFYYRSIHGVGGPDVDFDNWAKTMCISGGDCSSMGVCTGADCVHPPVCPDGVYTPVSNMEKSAYWDDANGTAVQNWALRGAINAGLAVFLYLDSITKGGQTPQPAYDACDQLLPSAASGGDAGTK